MGAGNPVPNIQVDETHGCGGAGTLMYIIPEEAIWIPGDWIDKFCSDSCRFCVSPVKSGELECLLFRVRLLIPDKPNAKPWRCMECRKAGGI
jgi:hypothetical protein